MGLQYKMTAVDAALLASLSANVQRLRMKAGLSQIMLSKKANIGTNEVQKIEACLVNPSLLQLRRIAAALKVGLEVLIKK